MLTFLKRQRQDLFSYFHLSKFIQVTVPDPKTIRMQQKQYGIFSLPVIVGALGFFVDIYDLLLFNIVRRASFKELGVAEDAMKNVGEDVLIWQMIGLTIGGILWGILGDKKEEKMYCSDLSFYIL